MEELQYFEKEMMWVQQGGREEGLRSTNWCSPKGQRHSDDFRPWWVEVRDNDKEGKPVRMSLRQKPFHSPHPRTTCMSLELGTSPCNAKEVS